MSVSGFSIRSKGFNISAPGANTNILSTGITPQYGAAFRITVALTAASVFNVEAVSSGTTHVWGLNSSVALNAADLFTFTFGVNPDVVYNFQVETNGVIEFLQVDEISGGVI